MFEEGSHIARDQSKKGTVDTGEWLFDRNLLCQLPFPTRYSRTDVRQRTTEDTKLVRRLLRAGVEIECTGLPTLKYYLGGYSNRAYRPRGDMQS